MATLALRNIIKRFDELEVIRSVDLEVDDGEFVVFVGPSGCGKSTLLRMIAGLDNPNAGTIEIDGDDVSRKLPLERGVAMVFQSYALYPHMTVEENIGFGLKIQHVPKREKREKVLEAARVLQLEPLLQRKPKALSGGQRQRVAIGRAIVKKPKIFLFDEPLSNLDAELRVQMRLEIARLHQELGATMVFVTHDQVEAMTLADKIVVLRDGQVEQAGAPVELYENPQNLFVAGFIGSPRMNLFEGTVRSVSGGRADVHVPALGEEVLSLPVSGAVAAGDTVTAGFRPQHCTAAPAETGAGVVRVVEHLGNLSYIYVQTASGAEVTVEQSGLTGARPGQPMTVRVEADRMFLFGSDGARV